MSTPLAGKFQDHYAVLGITPKADSDAIHRAYSSLATKYHPNNKLSGDKEKFAAVTHAYEVLADPMARQAYDSLRRGPEEEAAPQFSGAAFFDAIAHEARRRSTVLSVLYDRRRQKPQSPSLSMRQLENLLRMNSEELTFTVWYLKQRSLVRADDKSSLQITFEGMDYLEKHMPSLSDVSPFLKPSNGR